MEYYFNKIILSYSCLKQIKCAPASRWGQNYSYVLSKKKKIKETSRITCGFLGLPPDGIVSAQLVKLVLLKMTEIILNL